MNRLLLLLGMAGLLLAAGCRKDDIVDCAPSSNATNTALEDFTQRNGVPVQTFTVLLGPNNAIQAVTTSAGARITFPASSFLLPNGTPANGPAQMRVREIYTVPDMVLSNMPTTRGGSRKLLISGGEFSIQVWQNGVRLRLAPGATRVTVQSPVPTGAASGQQTLWQQPSTRLAGDSAGWIPPTPLPGLPASNDTILVTGTPPIYQTPIPLDSVSWWNIDQLWRLYQTAPVGMVTVQVPAIPAGSTGATRVFLRATGLNGLARLYPANAALTNWAASMPTGAGMVAVVLQSINGQLYYGTQPLTTRSGLVVAPGAGVRGQRGAG
ncbi:MAG: hypothetical protein EOO59_12685, partial [Hymenobacter sp.]